MTDVLLNTAPEQSRIARLTGRIEGHVREAARHADVVDGPVETFSAAVDEQWPILVGVASSGAHGWQIVTDDDGSPSHLDDAAFFEDVSLVVFENGFVKAGDDVFEDGELVETVADLVDRRRNVGDDRREAEQAYLDANDDVAVETGPGGRDLPGWWAFEPAGFVGRPVEVAAFKQGYESD